MFDMNKVLKMIEMLFEMVEEGWGGEELASYAAHIASKVLWEVYRSAVSWDEAALAFAIALALAYHDSVYNDPRISKTLSSILDGIAAENMNIITRLREKFEKEVVSIVHKVYGEKLGSAIAEMIERHAKHLIEYAAIWMVYETAKRLYNLLFSAYKLI